MLLLIDNYDSFTYILYQYLREWDDVEVIQNSDPLPSNSLQKFSGVVLSPGPGLPKTSGKLMDHISFLIGKMPILGVCLGHQALAESFGGKLEKAGEIFHGRPSSVFHKEGGIFRDIPSPFSANRYHSWVVSPSDFPKELEVTAETENGVIMGIRHKTIENIYGVQFHPESILTEFGKKLIRNFCEIAR
ncbi:anthranilate synthase component II [Leptospira idonii]|uniref:Aminodeoxychorismate/anthranilate synthase component II n=1 Tax=Leptospira idonii TaxID=1193500 RepID=A0A4R9M558_9LEPT|nr:aminodeoxychorismate/anthranilate synthase component II [Leptospira idonii]TGN20369.1 aminodeoxychorismate/anthranilate synthase component II [Leptospira idonii]